MLKLKILFQLSVLTIIPSLLFGQNIKLTVFNKTGYNLDSVSFGRFQLGKINKDSCVFLSDIDEIIIQGDVPLHRPFGIIKGKRRLFNLSPCSTKSTKKKSGSYAFDIYIYETKKEYRLYWKKHE
jgi:hypothetical protein